ncbi:MAG: hypothetical protein GX575_14740 [Candidatus Anammoximicrobium sp.]|nr:hypothetical protein [Candidatus Anammoximicrobium sp.]
MQKAAADSSLFLFTLLAVGVGGSGLALVGIWVETRLEQNARRVFSGVLCSCLGVASAVLWGLHQPWAIVGPVLALGAATLAVCTVQTALARRWANRLYGPVSIWTLLLVVSPLFSLLYARHVNKADPRSVLLAAPDPTIRKEPTDPRAVTDQGREIELFHYGSVHSLERLETAVIELAGFSYEVIRIQGPSPDSNCHGWVFTGGLYCVASEQVDAILTDNGYRPVEQAEGGDLIIYSDDSGLPAHSGVVRFVTEDGRVLVESKWGPLGVFLHAPETQPFSRQFSFWRSPRAGHRLHVLPMASAVE